MARPAKRKKTDDDELFEQPADVAPNPVWFKPVMVGFMLLGLAWIIVTYISNMVLPIPGIGGWNLVTGFGIAGIGFLMTMRWR